MDNNTAQLQNTVNTPVTNTIPEASVPSDLATTDLTKLQATFNDVGSGFNKMGEALAQDVGARQQLLIGNNLAPTGGTGIGDINYDTYYEQGLATGANAIRQEGTKLALNEGMRRAQEEAKKRAEKAQKDYNDRVAAANARRAAEAQAAQAQANQAMGTSDVQSVQISSDKLKKYGADSAADLAKTNPEAFEKEMQLAVDASMGVNNNNVWKYRGEDWYKGIDAIYDKFGATKEQRQDERSGNQTEASKKFWADAKHGSAFNSLMLSQAGYSPNYYKTRNNWVSEVNNKVQNLIETGGTIDQINKTLSESKLSFEVKSKGNNNAYQDALDTKHLFADPAKMNAILGKLSDSEKQQLKAIKDEVDAALKYSSDTAPDGNSAVAEYMRANGHENGIAGLYNRATEIISKSGINIGKRVGAPGKVSDANVMLDYDGKGANIQQAPKKKAIKDSTYKIELNGADAVSSLLNLRAEDIAGIHRWKTEAPEDFKRNMDIVSKIHTTPIVISDGSMVDGDGKQITAGTTVIYSYKGSEELESHKRLMEVLKSKPVVYSDGTGSYGWADVDGVAELYDDYTTSVSKMISNNYRYFGTAEAGTGKGASIIISRDKSRPTNTAADKKSENNTLKYKFGGKVFNDSESDDDIVESFGKLAGKQKLEFYNFLVSKSGYNRQGEQGVIKDKGRAHGVVDSSISKEEAQDLLMVMHSEMSQFDSDGKATGLFKPVNAGVSGFGNFADGILGSAQGGINFFAGYGYALAGVPADLISNISGASSRPGYVSMEEKGKRIVEGDGGGLVKFGDGAVAHARDVRAQENMFIYSGFKPYQGNHGLQYGIGEAAEFMGSVFLAPAVVAGAKIGSSTIMKAISRNGSKQLETVLVENGARNAAAKAGGATGDILQYETKVGGGSLGDLDIRSNTMEITKRLVPDNTTFGASSTRVQELSTKALSATEAGSIRVLKPGVMSADGLADGARVSLKKSGYVVPYQENLLSPYQELMFKNTARSQLTHYGAKASAYDSSSRYTRAVAVAMFNGGTKTSRKAAAALINLSGDLAKQGRKLRPDEAFKFAAQNISSGSVAGLKALNILGNEAKWTAGYMGWSVASETGSHEGGRYAAFKDENGNVSTDRMLSYAGNQVLEDAIVGAFGFGILAPAIRATKVRHYNKGLDKWSNIAATAEEGSDMQLKAMQKIGKISEKANRFSIEAMAKFTTEGNSVRFRELSQRSTAAALALSDEVTAALSRQAIPEAAGKKLLSIADATTMLGGKIGYNTMYSKSIVALKVRAKDEWNKLAAGAPTMFDMDNKASIRMFADIYRSAKKLSKEPTPQQYLDLEIEVMGRHGVPEAEVRFMRRAYEDLLTQVQHGQEAGLIPKSQHVRDGIVERRSLYYSTAGIMTPAHAKVAPQYAGINIASGISNVSNPTMARKTDFAEIIFNAEKRLTKQGGEIADININMVNPIMSLHAYGNKVRSDLAAGRMRKARAGRWDYIKVVDDEVFNLEHGVKTKYQGRVSRAEQKSEMYTRFEKKLVKHFIKNSPKVKGNEDRAVAHAEAFINNISSGIIGPTDIEMLIKLSKDSSAVDDFLIHYTGLHVSADKYKMVYKHMVATRAIKIFEANSGRQPTKSEYFELDKMVNEYWAEASGAKVYVGKGRKPTPVREATKSATDGSFKSPAEIFRQLEIAKDKYVGMVENYSGISKELLNFKFSDARLSHLDDMTDEQLSKLTLKLSDIVDSPERMTTILATAPKEYRDAILSAYEGAVVKFGKVKGPANGNVSFFDVTAGGDITPTITIDITKIRAAGSPLKATLAHETMHVYDLLDVSTFGPKYFKAEEDLSYHRKLTEQRAHTVSQIMYAEAGYKQHLDVYDTFLSTKHNSLQDMIKAADDLNTKLDLKRVLEDYRTKPIEGVHLADNGITYIRRSDFEGSELATRYEAIGAGGKKNDSGLNKDTVEAIDMNIRALEAKDGMTGGDVYLDREFADMSRVYEEAGGDAFKKDSVLMKIGEASNELQQFQLAAGYSIFNAYTSRQFTSALGAKVFSDPKGAVELFNTYGRARSVESMRKYLADPETHAFMTDMALVSGDTSILDAIIDSVSVNPGSRTGVLDDIAKRIADAADEAAVDGRKKSGWARGRVDAIHRVVDDPTFKRFLPALMLETMMSTYRKKAAKLGRELNPDIVPGDALIKKELLKESYEDWEIFWGLHVGTRKNSGGITKFKHDTQAKFLTGQARGNTVQRILNGVFFALTYRLTMAARFLNGLISLNPATFKDSRYAGSRSLLASGISLMALAYIWNSSQSSDDAFSDLAAGFKNNDPNNLVRVLADFGSFGRFNIGNDGLFIDPFFSVFTLQNSVVKEGTSMLNWFLPPDRKLEGVQGTGQEIASLLLSPLRSVADLGIGTYYGNSVFGPGAYAIDPDTEEPIPYSPLDNVVAGAAHLLGLDTFGIGANLTHKGADIKPGRNGRGEFIGGSGLLQHEYIDAIQHFIEGDVFGALGTAMEMPIRSSNLGGKAKASLNGGVMESIRSYKQDYDLKVKNGNLTNEEKDAEYKIFAEKTAAIIGSWASRYNVLDDRPELIQNAQRVAVAFLSDEWSEKQRKIISGYQAAGINRLGGFDKKPHETDEEYEKRSQEVSSAYGAQMEKERAARAVLKSIGFEVTGHDYEDAVMRKNNSRDSINFQFKQVVEGKIEGQTGLKAIYDDYSTRIRSLRDVGDRRGAAELEAEYINKYDEIVSPYVKKYGSGILLRNYEFADMASKYVIIPSADYRRYAKDNGKKYWLQDRYGVGYRNSEALISDDNYFRAYQRLINQTLTGNSALALTKAEDMVKDVSSGRYTVSERQYNQLMQLFTKLRQNVK